MQDKNILIFLYINLSTYGISQDAHVQGNPVVASGLCSPSSV